MDLLSLEFYYPVMLSCCISFLLSKNKNKLLKYLAPTINLIIIINYTGDLGNGFFIMSFGISFLASLIFCISVDGVYKRKKTMIILIVAFTLLTLSIIMWKQINFSNDLANAQKYLSEKYDTTFEYISYTPEEDCYSSLFAILACYDGYQTAPELFTFKDKNNKEVHVTRNEYDDTEYNGDYNQYWTDDYQYDKIMEYIQQHFINLYSKIKYVDSSDIAQYHHIYYNNKNIEELISNGKYGGSSYLDWYFDLYIPTNLENKGTTLDEVIEKFKFVHSKYEHLELTAYIYDENLTLLDNNDFLHNLRNNKIISVRLNAGHYGDNCFMDVTYYPYVEPSIPICQ